MSIPASPRRHLPVHAPRPSLVACLLGLALLAGCATLGQPSAPAQPAAESAGDTACRGDVMGLLPGFERVDDPALLARAVAAPGKGGLCKGEVWRATGVEVSVYRLYGGDTRQFGSWWAFGPPEGTAATYRATYDICAEWNPLTEAVICRLPKGALVVVGPGQSARCDGGITLPPSPANQVLVRNAETTLRDCVTAPWTPPAEAIN